MCICVEKLGGGSLTFHFILSKLKFFVLKHILLLTKNNVFVLKTETGSSSLFGQHRLGCQEGGSSCLDGPVLWQSPQPELLTSKRQRSKSLWRLLSNDLCRTPCPVSAIPQLLEG